MPPKNTTTSGGPRKGPQFKPPRPVTAKPVAAAKRSAASGAKSSTARNAGQHATTVILSDDEDDDLEAEAEDDDDDMMEDAPPPARKPRTAPTTFSTPDPIPAPLLARLLYENFEDPNTQIQKGAMNLVGKYMEIFVREALARAKNERELSVKAGGISDGFLQVEDLEKLAPQLVLDF